MRENVTRVARVRRDCVSLSSLLKSRTVVCRITDPKNSTSGCCATWRRVAPTSGSGRSGKSKLMTSLPVTAGVVFNVRSVSIASAERCIESRESLNGESRDPASHVTRH